ncbi:extracellular solute-binding protein [Klebsiella oxytoca]|nr:extracellular solute-binding protein [Klebsiella oxytoca]
MISLKKRAEKFSASLNTPEVAQAMTFMRTMMCEKSHPAGGRLTPPPPTLFHPFRSGQSGMFFSGPYHIALFDKDPGKDNF